MLMGKVVQVQDVSKIANVGHPVVDRDVERKMSSADKTMVSESKVDDRETPRDDLKEAVDKLNKALDIFNVERRFVIDDKTKEVVVKIIDKNTGEVIDQIPPEEALKRYYEMQKFIGLLFNKRI